jgi:hypothetical protein
MGSAATKAAIYLAISVLFGSMLFKVVVIAKVVAIALAFSSKPH